jgi:hypothetical protein
MHGIYTSNLVLWGRPGFSGPLLSFGERAEAPRSRPRAVDRLLATVHVSAWTIAAALGVLVPAAIVNAVILVMRPVRTDAAASVGIRA